MRYDTVIIGGGLAALTAGIRLAKHGKKVCIVSAGQSALHFFSGSFDFLGFVNGQEVTSPVEAIATLPERHPYRRLGAECVTELLTSFPALLKDAGITAHGEPGKKQYRLTSLGHIKPTWLTLSDYPQLEAPDKFPWHNVELVNLTGYIDFYPQFLAYGLGKLGVRTEMTELDLEGLHTLRKSSSEMRATNIARVMTDETLSDLAYHLNKVSEGKDAILMPAVVGLYNEEKMHRLRSMVQKPLAFVPTMPASVPGVRCQILLRKYFESLGGAYLLGDTANRADFENGKIARLYTHNLDNSSLEADNYIIASGTFFSYGLVATIDRVYEPALGLDVEAGPKRTDWYKIGLYDSQPYMSYGVKTDPDFHPLKDGKPVSNLYAIGSILGGANTLKEASGGGTTIATSLHVADNILKS